MGFLSSLFGGAKELTKLGNAAANVKNMLDAYESDPDVSYLYSAAWICKVGIIDLINKNNWAPNYIVFLPVNGRQTKMTMEEILSYTVVQLKSKTSELFNYNIQQQIEDILKGGDTFYEVDKSIPQKMKDIILKI